jgi:hypothetical protein
MKKKVGFIGIALVVMIIIAGIAVMFWAVPGGDAIKNTMEKQDFQTLYDVNKDTPLLGLMLPEGAYRSLTFIKSVNGNVETVTIYYFDNHAALRTFYKGLDEPNNDEVRYRRGGAVFTGSKDPVSSIRWRIWAY